MRDELWQFSRLGWGLLCGKPSRVCLNGKFEHASKAIKKSIAFVKKRSEYHRLLEETEGYRKFLEIEWEARGEKALSILQKLSKLEFPDQVISVFATHPKQYNGCYLGNFCIGWGHPEEWKSYSVVYICHEIMHALTEGREDDILHTIIELMVDNELRIQLNGQGSYDDVPGHKNLHDLRVILLSHWKEYLANPHGDLFALRHKVAKAVKN